jgi:hypothetical protein
VKKSEAFAGEARVIDKVFFFFFFFRKMRHFNGHKGINSN